jgi:Icc protein
MRRLALVLCVAVFAFGDDSFHFVILGDRTGEAQSGVYEAVWKQLAEQKPAFVLSVGDTIQGLRDGTAEAEWREVERTLAPYRRLKLYLTPGNHDIWSTKSEALFRKHAGHAPYFGFDHGGAHFTVLDNSRWEQIPAEQMKFLESDLAANASKPLKFVVSHKPGWLLDVLFQNPNAALHRLAKKHGVQYVIAGHVHQMLRMEFDGVTYLSMPSAGGHLRGAKKYEDGWFFGYTLVQVRGKTVDFEIRELGRPHGQGRVTRSNEWGKTGLVR